MEFWHYDFLLKALFIAAVVFLAVYFDSPWFLVALTCLPLVEV